MKQTVLIGAGSITKLPEIIRHHSAANVFLVTGGASYKNSGAQDAIENIIRNNGVFRFHDFSENPRIADVGRGIELFRRKGGDIVIAAGGGSVIDMAKLIALFAGHSGDPEQYITSGDRMTGTVPPIVAIPTTAGSGSEATHFAVVYKDGRKYSVADSGILPRYAIVDPELTYSMSPKLTAVTGFDALSQAVESFWAVGANDESRGYAREALPLILKNLVQAVRNPDPQTRLEMARAAHLAGKAINISRTTAPHAISYTITMNHGVPHGHAVALTLGAFIEKNTDINSDNCSEGLKPSEVRAVMNELIELLGCGTAKGCRKMLRQLMESVGLETQLRSLNIAVSDLDLLASSVNTERLENNPVTFSHAEIEQILGDIY
jgi:alcohol dehydrogenase